MCILFFLLLCFLLFHSYWNLSCILLFPSVFSSKWPSKRALEMYTHTVHYITFIHKQYAQRLSCFSHLEIYSYLPRKSMQYIVLVHTSTILPFFFSSLRSSKCIICTSVAWPSLHPSLPECALYATCLLLHQVVSVYFYDITNTLVHFLLDIKKTYKWASLLLCSCFSLIAPVFKYSILSFCNQHCVRVKNQRTRVGLVLFFLYLMPFLLCSSISRSYALLCKYSYEIILSIPF